MEIQLQAQSLKLKAKSLKPKTNTKCQPGIYCLLPTAFCLIKTTDPAEARPVVKDYLFAHLIVAPSVSGSSYGRQVARPHWWLRLKALHARSRLLNHPRY
jgi:hypothetical protein